MKRFETAHDTSSVTAYRATHKRGIRRMSPRVYRRRRIGAVIVLLLLVSLAFLAYCLLPVGGRVVLLGSDAREPEATGGTGVSEASRSDTILVAKPGKGALSIPRDTLVEIPGAGYGEDKINAAFAYGGPELMVETLDDLTGLSTNNYVVLDFGGVKDIVDALGGIELEVEEPITVGLDGQKVEIPAGRQNLDGLEALAYVRYRGGPTADIGRIANQQKFLSALVREATSPSKVLRWPATFGAIRDNTETNMNMLEVARYLVRTGVFTGLLGGSVEAEIYPGTPQYIEGVAYWVPNKETAAPLIEETIE